MKRLFMYHGAEHKTIACYEAEDELTPQNAMKYKRLHPRCGTNYLFLVMAIAILVLTCVDVVIQYGFNFQIDNSVLAFLFRFGIRIICLPLIAGISYEVLQAAAKKDNWLTKAVRAPGMGLQFITTKEPTEDMIEVAIAHSISQWASVIAHTITIGRIKRLKNQRKPRQIPKKPLWRHEKHSRKGY